ncbi:hypothetical protein B0H17DRAFT_37392 [Mycena rosella]|uniref:Uncharacterized protein n=1 Tax=Mycena rosella TaxID=1033263 RepID=A0AAD7D7N9_MYCRO|nr:hypothetical protein B0H17DRAFT_37392 [Mycena rosella]
MAIDPRTIQNRRQAETSEQELTASDNQSQMHNSEDDRRPSQPAMSTIHQVTVDQADRAQERWTEPKYKDHKSYESTTTTECAAVPQTDTYGAIDTAADTFTSSWNVGGAFAAVAIDPRINQNPRRFGIEDTMHTFSGKMDHTSTINTYNDSNTRYDNTYSDYALAQLGLHPGPQSYAGPCMFSPDVQSSTQEMISRMDMELNGLFDWALSPIYHTVYRKSK